MLILDYSYWLKFWSNQWECLKTSVALFYAENIFTGLGPDLSILSLPIFTNPLKLLQVSFSLFHISLTLNQCDQIWQNFADPFMHFGQCHELLWIRFSLQVMTILT